MAILLKQSTASQEVPLGYFLDSADGNTEETGLTIANTDIKMWKAGATTLANKNSGGATHIANGVYYAVLDATDTNTLGPLVIFCHVSGALAVRVECLVLAANVYDSLVAASDNLQVHAAEMSNNLITAAVIATGAIDADAIATDAITAAKIAADAIGASELAADAVTEIQSGLATAAALSTVDSNVSAILVDTGTTLDGKLNTIDGIVDAILVDTDTTLPASIAALPTAAANADAVWDEARSGHATAGTFGEGFQALVNGQAITGTLSTTQMTTNLSEATDDHYNGRIVVFITGNLAGQATDITDYVGSSKRITMTALTESPANGDRFVIV
jgi:hypothetical protein